MKSAGRETFSARPVIGSVDVFDPSSASGARCGSISANTCALTAGSSNTASITRSAPSAAAGSVGRRDPTRAARRPAPGSSGRARAPSRPGLCRIALAALGRLQRDVLEDHLDARLGAHVGDRGAHHAGAEDDDLARPERLQTLGPAAVAADALEVEEERLDHVLGHLAGDQVDEVAALDLRCVVEVDLGALDRGGHDVMRRRVIGALDLLAQVGRERRQVLASAGVLDGVPPGDLVLRLGVPGLLGVAGWPRSTAWRPGSDPRASGQARRRRRSPTPCSGRSRWP